MSATAQGDKSTIDVLLSAISLLETKGWTQITGWPGQDRQGRLCIEGALMAALGLDFRDDQQGEENLEELRQCPAYQAVRTQADIQGQLWTWNDERGRTKEEVLSILEQTLMGELISEGVFQ